MKRNYESLTHFSPKAPSRLYNDVVALLENEETIAEKKGGGPLLVKTLYTTKTSGKADFTAKFVTFCCFLVISIVLLIYSPIYFTSFEANNEPMFSCKSSL